MNASTGKRLDAIEKAMATDDWRERRLAAKLAAKAEAGAIDYERLTLNLMDLEAGRPLFRRFPQTERSQRATRTASIHGSGR